MRRLSGLAALVLILAADPGTAGCLAPADVTVDLGVSGPFAGISAGSLLYARPGLGGKSDLVLRPLGGVNDPVAVGGDRNGFSLGALNERWDAFHNGAVNADGDVAFIA